MARLTASILAAILTSGILPIAAQAQPADLPVAAADGSPLPSGVKVARKKAGRVYTDHKGRVLYGMDMRTVLRWSPDASRYCAEVCEADWAPLLAPAGSAANIRFPREQYKETVEGGTIDPRKAPDWTIIEGPRGPQWVYKGWHMVFTRRTGDARSTAFDGADGMIWNTLKFVPPAPKPVTPATVTTVWLGDGYALTDLQGHVLFTGKCHAPCGWTPLPAPMAGSGIGEWTVSLAGDLPQWTFKSKPVFVSTEDDPKTVPSGTAMLRP